MPPHREPARQVVKTAGNEVGRHGLLFHLTNMTLALRHQQTPTMRFVNPVGVRERLDFCFPIPPDLFQSLLKLANISVVDECLTAVTLLRSRRAGFEQARQRTIPRLVIRIDDVHLPDELLAQELGNIRGRWLLDSNVRQGTARFELRV